MINIRKLAELPVEEDILFREDSSITNALKHLAIGQHIYWDSDEALQRSFHAVSYRLGIKISCKQHKRIACMIVQRIR